MKQLFLMPMTLLISTSSLTAQESPKDSCRNLFIINFKGYELLSVEYCSKVHFFGDRVLLIKYRDKEGRTNLRQCIVGGGYVRIPSVLSEWNC